MITLTPLQTVYQQGDEVVLKLNIPSLNTFYGEEVDLFAETHDDKAKLTLSSDQLYLNNNVTIIKGDRDDTPNWFYAVYNPVTQNYELEVRFTLNRTGIYTIWTADYIWFQGESECNRYRIDTNITGAADNFTIEFLVE